MTEFVQEPQVTSDEDAIAAILRVRSGETFNLDDFTESGLLYLVNDMLLHRFGYTLEVDPEVGNLRLVGDATERRIYDPEVVVRRASDAMAILAPRELSDERVLIDRDQHFTRRRQGVVR